MWEWFLNGPLQFVFKHLYLLSAGIFSDWVKKSVKECCAYILYKIYYQHPALKTKFRKLNWSKQRHVINKLHYSLSNMFANVLANVYIVSFTRINFFFSDIIPVYHASALLTHTIIYGRINKANKNIFKRQRCWKYYKSDLWDPMSRGYGRVGDARELENMFYNFYF